MASGSEARIQVPADMADLMVVCPVEKYKDEAAQRFDDFSQTEIGQKYAGEVIQSVGKLEKHGIDRKEAMKIVLGSAALKDAAGEFLRAPAETTETDPEPAAAEAEPDAPKKKRTLSQMWSPGTA